VYPGQVSLLRLSRVWVMDITHIPMARRFV
jgi:hypothetical protein